MAKLSSDKTYVTVEYGDCLSWIAVNYKSYTGGMTYQQLGDANGITDYNKIYIGQKIYFNKSASSSSSSSSSSSTNKPEITAFGQQSNTDNTLFATWTWSKHKDHTKSYLAYWTYATGDGVGFVGQNRTITVDSNNYPASLQDTYTLQGKETKVAFKVKPISEEKDSSTKSVHWTANWSDTKTFVVSEDLRPTTPDTPTVKIEGTTLTATLDNIGDIHADSIQFQVVKNNKSASTKDPVTIKTGHVSYSCTVATGAEYKVRARSVKDDEKSDWSDYSENILTKPAKPTGFTTIKANSETSVYLEWDEVSTAETYEIEYTTEKRYFDGSDETTTKSGIESTHWEITGLETGQEYFFRVRAVNETDESDWSSTDDNSLCSIVLGTTPAAPTTWSSSTTVIVGEALTLYWVHNSEDGSSQTYADLEITIDGVTETHIVENSTDEDEKDRTSTYVVNTSLYPEGTQIQWRVRTAGVTKEYGEWSIERVVDIYAQPTLDLSVTDINGNLLETLETFPFYVYGLPGPKTQAPIGYHLTITSNQIYETVDNLGNSKTVNLGEELYSKHFDINDPLLVEMSANNINLDNGMSYTITCTVSMDSGLTAVETAEFTVSWADVFYDVNAEIGINKDTLSAYIRPYCADATTVYRLVTESDGVYTETDETVDDYDVDPIYTETGEKIFMGMFNGSQIYYCAVHVDSSGNMIDPIYYLVEKSGSTYEITSTEVTMSDISSVISDNSNEVLMGVTADGTNVMYVVDQSGDLVEGVTLSVYRREFDGTYTELMTGIDNTANTYITDPHPALDYARYRVVAKTNDTGAVSYYDMPGVEVGEKSIIIQWDEDWSTFNVLNRDEPVDPPWSGSMLKLPYNIDVSDNYDVDVSLIEYVGRKHPVTYYGTQIGSTSHWSTEIDKSDKELLYSLRRLAIWAGDVYVREPSGSGYWANISVSFSQTHCELTIPVTFDITRVEGGV